MGEHAELWEKAIRKLKAGMMPPPGARRPEKATADAFAAWLETSLDAAAAAHPDPGRVAVHRLNRTEYANAIDALLALKIDPAAMLPKDDEADGFDNIASSLAVSPSFLDQYISAARVVTNRALGVPGTKATSVTYRPARGTDQAVRVDGLPLGTRGGLVVEHNFPADGDYKLNVNGLPIAGYLRGMEYQHTVVVLLDGVKIFENTIGGPEDLKNIDQQQAAAVTAVNNRFQNIPVKTTAGPHKLGVTFVARTLAESDDVLFNFRPGTGEERIPKIGTVDVLGPFTAESLGDTPSRQRVLICKPASPADEEACAKKILTQLARRAYRRPVTEQDLSAPMAFYARGREGADFEAGIREALPTILASPKFLYRAERTPAGVAPGAVHRITTFDLASRLSFFLTGRGPDEELLRLAERGTLADPAVLDAQVKRLLAAPTSHSLVNTFAFQWLKMRSLDEIEPDAVVFPNFDESLREAFKSELALFIGSIIEEDRSVLDFMTANHTYRERAAGAALWHSLRSRRAHAPRDADRLEPVRAVGQGRCAAGHVLREPHGAGDPRRVDPGEPARHAAGGAAAGRRGVPGKQGRREGAVGARHHGAAPRQAVVQRLSRRDGSARVRARELRRGRRVALEGSLRR